MKISRTGICVIAAVLLLGLIAVLQCELLLQSSLQRWMWTVRTVTQQGSSEAYVVRSLGKPERFTPQEAGRLIRQSDTHSTIPAETRTVLYYEWGGGVSSWMAYIFVDKDGNVLGHILRFT